LSFWPVDGILFQEHPFSSSSNNHLTWQSSISLYTCAPSPKCLNGSARRVRRSRHPNLMERRSISLYTCAPSPKCLDGSARRVRRSRHPDLMERNPGVKINSAFTTTYCTPAVDTNPSDLVQVL